MLLPPLTFRVYAIAETGEEVFDGGTFKNFPQIIGFIKQKNWEPETTCLIYTITEDNPPILFPIAGLTKAEIELINEQELGDEE